MISGIKLVTKFSTGKDWKTAHERLKGQPSNKPLAQFGEHVLYLPLEAPTTDELKIENKMKEDVSPNFWPHVS